MSNALLYILNAIYAVSGVVLLCEGIGYFLYIYMFTRIRNSDHYLLDFTPHWPEILPWIVCCIGVFAISVSCCGCCVSNRKRGFVITQACFTALNVTAAIAASVLAIVYTDTQDSADFLKEALYDAFSELKINPSTSASFERIETWLQCCGVDNPTDYKRIMSCFPKSCCGSEFRSQDCEYTSKIANERNGCASVAAAYSSVAVRTIAASLALNAFFGVLSLIALVSLRLPKREVRVKGTTNNIQLNAIQAD